MFPKDIFYELFRAITNFETAWALAQTCKQNYRIFRGILPEKNTVVKSRHNLYYLPNDMDMEISRLYLFDKLVFESSERFCFRSLFFKESDLFIIDFNINNLFKFSATIKDKITIRGITCIIGKDYAYVKNLSNIKSKKLQTKIVNYLEFIYGLLLARNFSNNVLKSYNFALDIAKVNWPGPMKKSGQKQLDYIYPYLTELLPPEIVYHIFDSIEDYKSAYALGQTCRAMYQVFKTIEPQKIRYDVKYTINKNNDNIDVGITLYVYENLIFHICTIYHNIDELNTYTIPGELEYLNIKLLLENVIYINIFNRNDVPVADFALSRSNGNWVYCEQYYTNRGKLPKIVKKIRTKSVRYALYINVLNIYNNIILKSKLPAEIIKIFEIVMKLIKPDFRAPKIEERYARFLSPPGPKNN